MGKSAGRKNSHTRFTVKCSDGLMQCAAKRNTAPRCNRIGRIIGIDEDWHDWEPAPCEVGAMNIGKGMAFVLIGRYLLYRANIEFGRGRVARSDATPDPRARDNGCHAPVHSAGIAPVRTSPAVMGPAARRCGSSRRNRSRATASWNPEKARADRRRRRSAHRAS